MIGAVTITRVNATTSAGDTSPAVRAATKSLLPQPMGVTATDCGDAMSMLYIAMSAMSEASATNQKQTVNVEKIDRDAQVKNEIDSINASMVSASKGGFWHHVASAFKSIGKVAAIVGACVAAAASMVVTCGASGPLILAIASVVLSAGSMVVSKTKCFGNASQWIAAGMAVGAAVCGVGGSVGLASSATSIASTAASSASAASSVASTVGSGLQLVGGVSQGIGGGAEISAAHFDGQTMSFQADSTQAEAAARKDDRATSEALNDMQHVQQSQENALSLLQGAMQTRDDSSRATIVGRS
jgi:hypothetical protein